MDPIVQNIIAGGASYPLPNKTGEEHRRRNILQHHISEEPAWNAAHPTGVVQHSSGEATRIGRQPYTLSLM